MRENRASYLVGWKTHPTIYCPGRGSNSRPSARRSVNMIKVSHALTTRPRRRLCVCFGVLAITTLNVQMLSTSLSGTSGYDSIWNDKARYFCIVLLLTVTTLFILPAPRYCVILLAALDYCFYVGVCLCVYVSMCLCVLMKTAPHSNAKSQPWWNLHVTTMSTTK